jgi:pyrimidine operon attenuation protein/uracil phosphoribosyltransferase
LNQTLDIDAALKRMNDALETRLSSNSISDPVMIGIHTGGVWVAERLHAMLGLGVPLGSLDISFYRDDFTRIGLNPEVKASDLPVDVEDRHIILVDDVLQSGRTIRAAMNEIFDYGRPASITLAVLIEREQRELPIRADIVGAQISLPAKQQIKLSRNETGELIATIQEPRP